MIFNFSEECAKYQVNEAFTRRIDQKLFPLLDTAINRNPTFNMFLLHEMREANKMMFKNFVVFQRLLEKIRTQLELDPKEISILFMIDYLVATESLYKHIVDVVSYALISNGLILTDQKTDKEIVLPDEIRLAPLGAKLDFLKSNGFSMMANCCCIRLRNSFAHLAFTLDNTGNIHLPKGDIIKIFEDMNRYHDKLRDAAIGGHIALRHFYYEKYAKNRVS